MDVEKIIDAVYGDKYATLCAGLVATIVIVFRDKLRLGESRFSWFLLNFLFLITLLVYESNETLAFMMGAVVAGSFGDFRNPLANPLHLSGESS
jgi:hypothetical protein